MRNLCAALCIGLALMVLGADTPATAPAPKENLSIVLGDGVSMDFVLIRPGSFMMGSDEDLADERPARRVTISRPFYLGKFEVTQKQWNAVMGSNPSIFKGDANLPMENVSWEDAVAFSNKLSQTEGKRFRLPTEAEWEYACRAGTTTPFSTGANISTSQANYDGNFPYRDAPRGTLLKHPTPVGSYAVNPWGLYDMHGNLWEWCADWYAEYPRGETTDPTGPAQGFSRVLRGGSWGNGGLNLRSAYRGASAPYYHDGVIGFRIALDL